ncbi:MAG: hypothetical protein [Microvirus sp.]|nr:MAG: hypothetical protein [Microvirus sp.]
MNINIYKLKSIRQIILLRLSLLSYLFTTYLWRSFYAC